MFLIELLQQQISNMSQLSFDITEYTMLSLCIAAQITQSYLRTGNVKLPSVALHKYYRQLQPFALKCNQSKPALKETFPLARHGGEVKLLESPQLPGTSMSFTCRCAAMDPVASEPWEAASILTASMHSPGHPAVWGGSSQSLQAV